VFFLSPFFPAFSIISTSVSVISLTPKIPRARLLQLNYKHFHEGNYVLTLCGFKRPKFQMIHSQADVCSATNTYASLLQAHAQTSAQKACKCLCIQVHATRSWLLHNALSNLYFLFDSKKFSNRKYHLV